MISFQKLWENIEGKEESNQASSAIRTGIGIREDFWDDFLLVINNSAGLSDLLDIPVTKIFSWRERVKSALNLVQEEDLTPDSSKSKKKMIHTGLPSDNLEEGL